MEQSEQQKEEEKEETEGANKEEEGTNKDEETTGTSGTDLNTIVLGVDHYLDNYFKDNKRKSIIVALLMLFRKYNYTQVEYTEIFTTLLNEFSQNKKKFTFIHNVPKGQSMENTVNSFCSQIDEELNKNPSFSIEISEEKKKVVKLDLFKLNEYFAEHNIILRPKRIYKKRNKAPKAKKKSHKKLEEERLNKIMEITGELPDIFRRKLHNECLSKTSDDDLFDNILQKSKIYINNIKHTTEIEDLSNKIKNINLKVTEISKNKRNYNNIKKLIQECQFELSNIYNIVKSEVDMRSENKNDIIEYQNKYIRIVDKIKNYISTLYQLEKVYIDSGKEINTELEDIVSLYNKIIGSNNPELDKFCQKCKINIENYNKWDVEEITNNFLSKINGLVDKYNRMEEQDRQDELLNFQLMDI
jgi:hypothetical protein